MKNRNSSQEMRCKILSVGAWGSDFTNWEELQTKLLQKIVLNDSPVTKAETSPAPKPSIIPANERRRAPLPVKMAVEVSSQALDASGLASPDVACVFGSGLGDTEITDYMCRAVNTESRQLSPTKFHNSVHNAAAGYWTISTHCMKSANSIAAFHETAGLCLMEAASQCIAHNEPVLITLFDTKAHSVYREIFDCESDFAAAILICPENMITETPPIASLTLQTTVSNIPLPELINGELNHLYQTNPAAKILALLEPLAAIKASTEQETSQATIKIGIAANLALSCTINPDQANHHQDQFAS